MSVEVKQIKSFMSSLSFQNENLLPIVTGILFGQGIAWSIKVLNFKVNSFFTYNGNKQTKVQKQYTIEYNLFKRIHKIIFIISATLWICSIATKKLSVASTKHINNYTFIRNVSCIATTISLIILFEIGIAIFMKKERKQAIEKDAKETVEYCKLKEQTKRNNELPIHQKLIELAKTNNFKLPEYSKSSFESPEKILDFVCLTIALNLLPPDKRKKHSNRQPIDKTPVNLMTMAAFGSVITSNPASNAVGVVEPCQLPESLMTIIDLHSMYNDNLNKEFHKKTSLILDLPHWTELATSKAQMRKLLGEDPTLLRYLSWPEAEIGEQKKNQFFDAYQELATEIREKFPNLKLDYLHPSFFKRNE